MIIKASQRGGALRLAKHLLNDLDNDHIHVHEVTGFMSSELSAALKEIAILSKHTKCKQFLFSVSINPPQGKDADTRLYLNTFDEIQARLGLTGQPRAIVFHEKNGRRHAHAVFSRIKLAEMKAVNLPFFKNKLMEISKGVYLDRGWKLPRGFIQREHRNPLNFSLEEWEHAKRLNDDPKRIKMMLQESYSLKRSNHHFQQLLAQRGFSLARGDRRGIVAVDWRGEVYSLSRWLGIKTKILRGVVGDPNDLPSVDEAKASFNQRLVGNAQEALESLEQECSARQRDLEIRRQQLGKQQSNERSQLDKDLIDRVTELRNSWRARVRKGLRGLWDRVIGRYRSAKVECERQILDLEVLRSTEMTSLIGKQLADRRQFHRNILALKAEKNRRLNQLHDTFGDAFGSNEAVLQMTRPIEGE